MPVTSSSTGVAITNPLVLYRALISTKRIDPDPAQHRLAIHLQKLYERLKDYEPIIEYNHRLQQISRALGSTPGSVSPVSSNDVTSRTSPSGGVLSSLWRGNQDAQGMALTRVLTSHQAALELQSPKGLMLYGEVGTGKSMLVDLFADCLPNRKKKRRHFSTFMLEIYAKLEHLRKSRQLIIPTSLGKQEEYSLLFIARDMISTSPILFLDEFQLPDRASAKIMTNLMTSFFHLGGVLIATSNRMPEELAKASGMEFSAPQSTFESISARLGFGRNKGGGKSERMFAGKGEFVDFVEVLKARCEVWEMNAGKDYRRRESGSKPKRKDEEEECRDEISTGFHGLEEMSPGNVGLGYEQSTATAKEQESQDEPSLETATAPKKFFIQPPTTATPEEISAFDEAYQAAQISATDSSLTSWSPSTMRVYGREVFIPRRHDLVTSWTFAELCGSALGPADYITLASTYHTLILTDVPVLTVLQKNEARRFITLLDALYEARCKLIISAAAGPDELFFPEKSAGTASGASTVDQDAILAETFSEAYQDATAPFRPNIAIYDDQHSAPSYSSPQVQELFAADQLEDTPPNTLRRAGAAAASSQGHHLDEQLHRPTIGNTPDFSSAGIFTGEDERFAYKRARSRLWEMCSEAWWARDEEGWWRPLDKDIRRWEGDPGAEPNIHHSNDHLISNNPSNLNLNDETNSSNTSPSTSTTIIPMRGPKPNTLKAEVDPSEIASPFRTHSDPPPKLSWTHVWGTVKWGKKAGAWGQGPEGLKDRKKEKEIENRKESEGKT